MLNDLIVCRSLTYAQHMAAVLKQAGISACLIRTPREISGSGCGYSIRVPQRCLDLAVEALSRNGVEPRGLYEPDPAGGYREVLR